MSGGVPLGSVCYHWDYPKVGRPADKSIYLCRSGFSLDKLLLFGVTTFVRPYTGKTDILNPPTGRGCFDIARTTRKNVFHQFEFVNKFNLETQNPRRDTSIPSVSAGLGYPFW